MSEFRKLSFSCRFLLSAAAVCLVGFSVRAKTTEKAVLIKDVPHIVQREDFCGEACVAMYLQRLGHDATQDNVFNAAGLDPMLGRGCVTKDMERVLKRIGFKPGTVWYKIDPRKSKAQLEAQWKALLADLRRGIPSIVCMRYDSKPKTSEHFRLILGYDTKKDEVIYHEPAEKKGAYRRMKRSKFIDLWPLKYKNNEWLAIRMSLKAGKIMVPKSGDGFTDADYVQHIMKLKPTVPKGFTIVLQRPFVVIGDERASTVRFRAERTVKWFSDRITRLYFKKEPPKIYDVWLFKDDKSYRKHAAELFGDRPDTPYGYCSDAHGALIMNIATGGGTLCHEMVHAYVASNFPDCPAWLNEGLGSLYEQSGTRGDMVVGLTNWRLAGLKKEIKADNLPSFEELLSTTTYQFYHLAKGNNYAQARYLCYYLQEKGLLVKFYNAFISGKEKDPSGYETLKKILKEKDMDAFKKRWEKWVMKLTFP
jgi:hypothetical protein